MHRSTNITPPPFPRERGAISGHEVSIYTVSILNRNEYLVEKVFQDKYHFHRDLPLEILEFVCTHLSQTTLRYGVNQVCKKWHEVSNRFIRRAGIWKPVQGAQELLLEQWSKINTLELWFNKDPEFPTIYIPGYTNLFFWKAFAATITASEQEVKQDDNIDNNNNGDDKKSDFSMPPSLLHTIRHLELRGSNMNYLDIAPKLRVSLPWTVYARLTHGDNDDLIVDVPEPEIDPATAHFPRKPWVIPPPKDFPDRYRLQKFSVSGVNTHLRILERLLVTCPDLRVFKANNTIVNMFIRQRGEDAERNSRQRLIDLAAKHCPKLEWYNFHRLENSATDEIHLEYIARTFPHHKFLSMTFCGSQETMPFNPAAKDLLSRITVLDIQPSPYVSVMSETLNRILCLTPDLLHLHCLKADLCTSTLWKPPAPVQPATVPVFANSETGTANTLTIDSSTPATWQLYNLKTLEMSLGNGSTMIDFTDYISQHRLFRNLVTFNLKIPSLKVGQRMTFVHPRKPATFAASPTGTTPAPAASNTLGYCKQYSSVAALTLEPERFPNELLALRGLRCLEECILRAADVPGMILAKDFEFLRRRDDFQTITFIPKRRKSSAKYIAAVDTVSTNHSSSRKNKGRRASVTVNNELDGTDDADEDEDDDDDREVKGEQMKTKTFWPKLNTFHIYYLKISPFISTSTLTYGVEQIRPGVAVSFQYRDILS
ncbi:hypothetical protein BGZ97_002822 [Linnemannia gamsii]|uniref:F-box domain-containing protein n=1 Tax=Linnemannia gamsii TaxID=64522 RepID=A0A9P6QU28_9FUNG|nr:hypothetical protein BGZ97_002822 [Linnemannia gamsii]